MAATVFELVWIKLIELDGNSVFVFRLVKHAVWFAEDLSWSLRRNFILKQLSMKCVIGLLRGRFKFARWCASSRKGTRIACSYCEEVGAMEMVELWSNSMGCIGEAVARPWWHENRFRFSQGVDSIKSSPPDPTHAGLIVTLWHGM